MDGASTFTHVCVDSSQTVLERHRPSICIHEWLAGEWLVSLHEVGWRLGSLWYVVMDVNHR